MAALSVTDLPFVQIAVLWKCAVIAIYLGASFRDLDTSTGLEVSLGNPNINQYLVNVVDG